MKHYIVQSSQLCGSIEIPSSKSHTMRAILFGALGKGSTIIENALNSSDVQSMINACRLFGSQIEQIPNCIKIQGINGTIEKAENVIDAGNSGIVLRFCTAIGALSRNPVVVTGDHSIRYHRPVKPLLDGLKQLGVSAISMRGDHYAPVIIHGPLKPGKAIINGEDSQPVSALLIASAFVKGSTELSIIDPGEKPWISLTLDWFDRLGISYSHTEYKHYNVNGGSCYAGFHYKVPGDFSSAAFPIAAALITGSELCVQNIDMNDIQGDKELISVFQKMGAKIEIDPVSKALYVKKGSQLSGIKVDINNFVDATTILAVVACYAEGETHIYNGAIAKQKECNRIHCIAQELKKMGADITETEDGLKVKKSQLSGAEVNSHQDHRMAMSIAVAALGAKGKTKINSIECVSKTFPSFKHDMQLIGASIKEMP